MSVTSFRQELAGALRLDAELRGVRRCYNDRSITTDQVSLRVTFTNISSEPIAMLPGVVVLSRTRLWESSAEGSRRQLVLDVSPEMAFGAPGGPAERDLAVLWPADVLALDETVTIPTLRPGIAPTAGVARRTRHLLSVTSHVRLARFEADDQPASNFRSVGFELETVPLDLSAPWPIEFCR